MTPEQMWQAVAESIEPKPIWGSDLTLTWPYYGRVWVVSWKNGINDGEWEVRPYDAEMCLMLLEKLRPIRVVLRSVDFSDEWCVYQWDRREHHSAPFMKTVRAKDLKHAVLEAYYNAFCKGGS